MVINPIKKSDSENSSSNINSSTGIDKHRMWSVIGVVFMLLAIGLLVMYPYISGKKIATAGQAVAGFSDEGCVAGPWVYKDANGQYHSFEAGCTTEFAEQDETTRILTPWCATNTIKDGSYNNVYIANNGRGTNWKECSAIDMSVNLAPEDCINKKDDNSDGKTDCADNSCKGKFGPDGLTCCSAENECSEAGEVCAGGTFLSGGGAVSDVCLGCTGGGELSCSAGKKCEYKLNNQKAYDSTLSVGSGYAGVCIDAGPEDCTNKKDDNGDGKTDCADSSCKGKFGPDGFTCCSAENKCLGDGEVCAGGTFLSGGGAVSDVCLGCTWGGQLSCSSDKECDYKISSPKAYDQKDLGTGGAGICAEPGKLNENCDKKKCATDLACDYFSKTCQKKDEYNCNSFDDCFKKCVADVDCGSGKGCFDYYGNSGHKECYFVAKIGEECGNIKEHCQEGAKCDSGTNKCVAPSCSTNDECTNGFSCDQMYCVGKLQLSKSPVFENVVLNKVYPFEYNAQIFSFSVSKNEQYNYNFNLLASNKGVGPKYSTYYLGQKGVSEKVELKDGNMMYVALKEDKIVDGKPFFSLSISSAQEVCTDTLDNDGDSKVDCDDVTCATHQNCLVPFGECKLEFKGIKKNDASLSVVDYVCDARNEGSSPKWLLLNYYGNGKCTNDEECQPLTICDKSNEYSENKYCQGSKGYPCTSSDYDCARGYECDLLKTKQCVKMTKELYCSNKFDDDLDGKVDCADSECSLDSYCLEVKDSCSNKGDKIGKFVCDNRGIGLQWLLPNWGDCTGDSECGSLMKCDLIKQKCLGIDEFGCKINGECSSESICSNGKCVKMTSEIERSDGCYDYFDNDGDGKVDCADSDCATSDDCLLAKSCTQIQAEKGVVKKGKQYTHVCTLKGSSYSWFRSYENYCDKDIDCQPGTVCQLSSYQSAYTPKGFCYGGEGFTCGEVGKNYFECAKGYDCDESTKKCTSPNGAVKKVLVDLSNTPSCGNSKCESYENCGTCSQDCSVCVGILLNELQSKDSDQDGITDDKDYCPNTRGKDGLTFTDGYVAENGCLAGDRKGSNSNTPDGCITDVDISILNDIIPFYTACTPIVYGKKQTSSDCSSAVDANDCDADGVVNDKDMCSGTLGSEGLTFKDSYVLANGCLVGDVKNTNGDTPDGCITDTDISVFNDILSTDTSCKSLN